MPSLLIQLVGSLLSLGAPSQNLPPAMSFPQTCHVSVVGNPAVASTVAGAVQQAIYRQVVGKPGATWTYTVDSIPPLRPGATETIITKVNATGPGYIQAYGTVKVVVKNEQITFNPDQFLWFCNSPENIKGPGPLYSNHLEPNVPVRILYHHICFNVNPCYMQLEVINPSDLPATLLICAGDSPPDFNPALAGYFAGISYLAAREKGSGEMISIGPNSRQIIALRKMDMGKAMSGLCSIELLPGGPKTLTVRADALLFASTDRATQVALIDPKPWHMIGNMPIASRDISNQSSNQLAYVDPYQTADVTVTAGKDASDTLIGVEGIPKVGGGRHLNGNFGVIYQYKVTLKNPTNSKQRFLFSMRANTGYSAGVFLIRGKTYGVRPEIKGVSRAFYQTTLLPHTNDTFTMHAIPVSGCFYPSSVWITSGG